jgi:hypothetical protein
LNWLADNAFSLANWSASARRVAALDSTIHKFNDYSTVQISKNVSSDS